MMIFNIGKISSFFFLILSFLILMFIDRRFGSVKELWIRRIPALDAIEESVGRATELGKPVLCAMGSGQLRSKHAGITLAGISIMSYVADLCAKLGTRIIVTPRDPMAIPLIKEIIQTAYLGQGNLEEYNENDIIFFGNQAHTWTSGIMGTIDREDVATHIRVGRYSANALLLAEHSVKHGTMTIMGTNNQAQLGFLFAICDYVLIGEECFAAGAYLSKDPAQILTIMSQDWIKTIVIALILVGTVLSNFGIQFIEILLKT